MSSVSPAVIRNLSVKLWRARAFSLIELAVALLILSLLMIGFFVPFGTQLEQRNQARTQASLEEIRQALYGFAMANGRLPRPAMSEIEGTESDTSCTHSLVCFGYLPWADLGVPATDAWGKYIRYGVTRKFSDRNAVLSLTDRGEWNIETRLPEDPTKVAIQASRVVAVLHSFGAKNFGTTAGGAVGANLAPTSPTPTNVDEIYNRRIIDTLKEHPERTPALRARGYSTSDVAATGGQFDDILVWMPTSLFMSRMVEAKKLP